MLITVEEYEVLTGDADSASSAVSAAVEFAQGLLAEHLGRAQIEAGEVTETLQLTPYGSAYPTVTPVTVPPTGVVYRLGAFEGSSIDGSPNFFPSDWYPFPTTTVTYTGGWTELTAPSSIKLDLAWAAWRLMHPPSTPIPAGATSAANGDASISYGPDGAKTGASAIEWSDLVSKHKARRL